LGMHQVGIRLHDVQPGEAHRGHACPRGQERSVHAAADVIQYGRSGPG
jgi:hypothetical protein